MSWDPMHVIVLSLGFGLKYAIVLYYIPNSFVLCKYLKIICAAPKRIWLSLCMNHDRSLVAYMIPCCVVCKI